MPSRAYHEALWEAVPPGTEPSDFALRLAFLLEHVQAGERVLDVGCGEGWFARELIGAGATVVGLDVAEEPLRRARLALGRPSTGRRAPEESGAELEESEAEPEASGAELDLRLMDADGPWPVDDASVDVVWAGETIEHVADTAGWLSEARRVLVPGGRLLLSTPDHGRLLALWWALSRRAFEAQFDPLGDHLHHYTRASLARLLRELGFRDVSVHAVAGAPGTRRLLLARAVRSRW